MATAYWTGAVDGDVSNVGNWKGGSLAGGEPGDDDDVIIPPWASNGMTSNLAHFATSEAESTPANLNSFWVQEGFAKQIGDNTPGTAIADQHLHVYLDGAAATRFRFEGESTLAKIHFVKTTQYVSIEVIKTGKGNQGQPALQLMTSDVAANQMGPITIYKGEVGLGLDLQRLETHLITIGERGSKNDAKVWIGKNVRAQDDTALTKVVMNGGVVINDAPIVTLDQFAGEFEHRNGSITTQNLWGGIFNLNNPPIATSQATDRITTLNLRGGSFRNIENPSEVEIGTANLYSGKFHDPAGKVSWDPITATIHNINFIGKWTDLYLDFGPTRTIRIDTFS